jgi:hypothetical protein
MIYHHMTLHTISDINMAVNLLMVALWDWLYDVGIFTCNMSCLGGA